MTEEELNDALSALTNPIRREIIRALREDVEDTDTATLEELQAILEGEYDLHETHLPMLDHYGVIDYDESTGELTKARSWKIAGQLSDTIEE